MGAGFTMESVMTEAESKDPVVVQVYVAINENAEHDSGIESEDAAERLRDNCGGDQIRIICLNLDITALVPQVIELEAALPKKEDGTFELAIKS